MHATSCTLVLSGSELPNVQVQGAVAFASMLQRNKSLKMLDLGGCDIKVHGLLALTAALAESNSTLESIGLEDCRAQSPPQMGTTRSIARMFAYNTGLKQVYLSKHALHDWDFEVKFCNSRHHAGWSELATDADPLIHKQESACVVVAFHVMQSQCCPCR